MIGMLGSMYAQSGRLPEAEKLMLELQGDDTDYDKMYARSLLLLSMRRNGEAIALLKKLVQMRYTMLLYMNVEQDYFDHLRVQDLQPLLETMNLK
jgi:hypothetical protein